MARTKLTREEVLEKKRQAERARYQKIKNDPQKFAQQREKEKLKYTKKKEQGKVKAVKDMTPRERRLVRKRRRKNVAAFRKRRAVLQNTTNRIIRENTPSSSDSEQPAIEIQRADPKILSAKKKSRRSREIRRKLLIHKEAEIQKLRKQLNNVKKRLQRAKKNNVVKSLTPKTKIKQMLEDPSSSSKERITKTLLFGEVMKQQLNENFSRLTSPKEKATFTRVVTGNLVHRYNILQEIGNISKKRRLQSKSDIFQAKYKRKSRKDKICNEIQNKVIQFLEEDCNTRLCAGKNDFVKKNGEKKQKRILSDTLKNLHRKFTSSHNINLSYSIFCKLRPFWIVQPKCSDRNTCLCVTHANLDLLLNGLYQSNIISVSNHQKLLEFVCCSQYTEICLTRKCSDCKKKHLKYNEFENTANIHLKQWQMVSENIINNKHMTSHKVKKYIKKITVLPPRDVIHKLDSALEKFFQHQFNIVHQYNEIKMLRDKITQEDCIIHMDFSENYNAKYSEEIQAFHFGGSRSQYCLHTVVIYTLSAENFISTTCVCTLSTNLTHGPAAIWSHLKPIFKIIPKHIRNIHFLSDGPVTQYRNKTMFFMLACQFQEFYPEIKRFTWNFHEAGHGKGAPDGVGAVCKRTADKFVSLGRDVSSLSSLATIIKENCPGIQTFLITDNDIEEVASIIDAHSEVIVPFIGTLRVHQVCGNVFLPNKIVMKTLSCFCAEENCLHYKIGEIHYSTESKSLVVDDIYTDSENEGAQADCSVVHNKKLHSTGDFVLIKLCSKKFEYKYAAICSDEIDEGEIKVTFLNVCGDNNTLFKLNSQDVSFVQLEHIICTLPMPLMISRGGRYFYKFPNSIDVFEK